MSTLSPGPAVSAVCRALTEPALAPLVLAFAHDPLARWFYPDAHQYRLFFPRLARAFAGQAFELGTAQRAGDFRGAALWLPPGVTPERCVLAPLVQETVAPARHLGVCALLEQVAARQPAEPHWYLPLLGIDPFYQGHGLGSLLLRQKLAACDRTRALISTHATSRRVVRFYQRHGFHVHTKIQTGDAPTLFAMIRQPHSTTHLPP